VLLPDKPGGRVHQRLLISGASFPELRHCVSLMLIPVRKISRQLVNISTVRFGALVFDLVYNYISEVSLFSCMYMLFCLGF
jgi:hypothetical protein